MTVTRQLTPQQKFRIAYRDNFTCQFCGAKPGNDNLEIEHMLPLSQNGSDNDENLVAACKKCNRNKAGLTMFPASMCEGKETHGIDGDEPWNILRSWGKWQIKWHPDYGAVLEYSPYGYWIGQDRAHECDWERHIAEKSWPRPHKYCDFLESLNYFRKLTRR